MPVTFNADEILEIAVTIEQNGQAFYGRAAEIVKDEEVKKLLLDLVAWEASHEKVFKEMRDRLATEKPGLTRFDPDGESAKYLQAIADGKIFNMKAMADELSDMTDNPLDILHTALSREKDSVIFFLAVKDMVPAALGRSRIHEIVEEEMSHIRYISDKIAELGG